MQAQTAPSRFSDVAEVERLRGALRAAPGDARLTTELGVALASLGHRDPARRAFEHALSLDPSLVATHLGLGALRAASGDPAGALAAFTRAHRLEPGNVAAARGLVAAFEALGCQLAATSYRITARRAAPMKPAILIDRARGFALAGLYEDAAAALALLVPPNADEPAVLFLRANVSAGQGEREQAAALYRRAVTAAPEMAEAWSNLGGTLAVLGAHVEAEAALRRALALQPSLREAEQNLANVLIEAQRHDEALSILRAMIARWPDRPEPRNNLANLLLLLGRFEEGWEAYEWRRRMPGGEPTMFGLPEWRGEALHGRALHVIGEQGPGDIIMFASCFGELAALDGPIYLYCEARLEALLARSFRFATVRTTRPERAEGLAVPLGSLPRFYRRTAESFGRNRAFLIPDPEAVAHWRARFAALGGACRIGISWRGGKSAVSRRLRTMRIEDWLPILSLSGAVLIDLQYGAHADEIERLERAHGIAPHRFHAEVDPKNQLDGLAAQLAALDLVVTIDNSTVHMAGALGTPTLALIPYAPSWRWQLGRADCLWYPNVELVRQAEGEPWSAVLHRAAGRIETLIEQRRREPARQILPDGHRAGPVISAGSLVNPAGPGTGRNPCTGDALLVSKEVGTPLAT